MKDLSARERERGRGGEDDEAVDTSKRTTTTVTRNEVREETRRGVDEG